MYAGALYFREKKIQSAVSHNTLRSILAGLRFLVAACLAFLLLNPYLKSRYNETEKPIAVILQDNSQSAVNALDTSAYKLEIEQLQKALSEKFDVRYYTFGEQVQENNTNNFTEKSTDISSALEELQNTYQNLNVGAIILATDGIYNTGSNPVYVKNNVNAPYYAIALGDTLPKKDIRISRVQHNNIVYLNDKFTVRCDVEAFDCSGTTTKISMTEISKNGNITRGEHNISVQANQFSQSIEFIADAKSPGILHFRLEVQKTDGEFSADNNVQDIYIEVLDARQKILLLANAPHPDVAALKQSIETNQNYDVTVALPSTLPANISEFSLLVLHNLPSVNNPVKNVMQIIEEKHLPVWYIAGNQTNKAAFNTVQDVMQINPTGPPPNSVTAMNELSFHLFTLAPATSATVPKLPPLAATYGKYSVSAASQVLLYQKIGTVSTKYPLLVYSLPGSAKVAVLCGENFYKWRMYDFVLNNTQDATNELVNKTVQYLAAKNDKKQFRVTLSNAQNVLYENEKIIFNGELYNDSYELINTPDAELTITNEEQKDFTYQFTKTANSYTLDAGFLPEGNYTYTASTNLNGKQLTDKGAFSIAPLKLETMQTTANHKILFQLAQESNGKVFYPSEIANISSVVSESASSKPVLHEVVKTQSLINIRWIFFLLLALLAAEWFVRKYSGSY